MADDIRYCEAQIFGATRIDPAEYCENEAEEGRDYCELHTEPDDYNPPEPEDPYTGADDDYGMYGYDDYDYGD